MLHKSTLSSLFVSGKKTFALLAVTSALTLNVGCTVSADDLEVLSDWVVVLTEMYDSNSTATLGV